MAEPGVAVDSPAMTSATRRFAVRTCGLKRTNQLVADPIVRRDTIRASTDEAVSTSRRIKYRAGVRLTLQWQVFAARVAVRMVVAPRSLTRQYIHTIAVT
jgi:hypothetical protein